MIIKTTTTISLTVVALLYPVPLQSSRASLLCSLGTKKGGGGLGVIILTPESWSVSRAARLGEGVN